MPTTRSNAHNSFIVQVKNIAFFYLDDNEKTENVTYLVYYSNNVVNEKPFNCKLT